MPEPNTSYTHEPLNQAGPTPRGNFAKRFKSLSKLSKLTVAGLLVVIIAIISGSAIFFITSTRPQISNDIISTAPFKLYVPKSLPSGFKIDPGSVKLTAQNSVPLVILTAIDSSGEQIVFTEQARPSNFDSTKFTQGQIVNPVRLSDVPYPSISGQTKDKQTNILSIVTPTTLVLATSLVSLGNSDLRRIASGSYSY